MDKALRESVFQFVDQVHQIRTVSELNRAFGGLIRQWGFERWACVQVSAAPGEIRQPLRRMFGEPPIVWIEHYKRSGHIRNDVAAAEVMNRSQPFWWSEILAGRELSVAQARVFDEARAFGLGHGLAIPIRFPDGSVWSCLLTAERMEEDADVKTAAFVAAQFYAGRGMFLRERVDADEKAILVCRLTPRQRELVSLLRRGFSQIQCADALGLSRSTVFNQINEAKERMHCRTVAELVAEALLNGEIDDA